MRELKDVMADLMSSGLDNQQLALVMEAVSLTSFSAVDRQREAARVRQQRKRDIAKAAKNDHGTKVENPSPPSFLPSFSPDPKTTPPIILPTPPLSGAKAEAGDLPAEKPVEDGLLPFVPVKRLRKTKGDLTLIPSDWEPTEADIAYGENQGFSVKEILEEAEAFVQRSEANGRLAVKWGSAFRQALLKSKAWKAERNGKTGTGRTALERREAKHHDDRSAFKHAAFLAALDGD